LDGFDGFSPTLEPCGCGEKKKKAGFLTQRVASQKPKIAYATTFGLRGSPSTDTVVADFSISPSGAVGFRDYGLLKSVSIPTRIPSPAPFRDLNKA
jgi:hypothetical protein